MAEIIPALSHLQPPQNVARIRLDRFSPYFNDPGANGICDVRSPDTLRLLYPFPAAERDALSYHFEFRYEDGRDLSYAAEMADLTRTWIEATNTGALIGFTRDRHILIWDERPVAGEYQWVVPDVIYRDLIHYCNDVRTLRDIHAFIDKEYPGFYSKQELRHLLADLIKKHYFVSEKDKYLSLIVINETQYPPEPCEDLIHHMVTGLPNPTTLVEIGG
jgi:hypothetical protein